MSKMTKLELCRQYADKWQENGEWWVTNEFIAGGFAGRAFVNKDLNVALQELVDYFDAHIHHKSIVGTAVDDFGWSQSHLVDDKVLTEASPIN